MFIFLKISSKVEIIEVYHESTVGEEIRGKLSRNDAHILVEYGISTDDSLFHDKGMS